MLRVLHGNLKYVVLHGTEAVLRPAVKLVVKSQIESIKVLHSKLHHIIQIRAGPDVAAIMADLTSNG